jgi:hypothetical protein
MDTAQGQLFIPVPNQAVAMLRNSDTISTGMQENVFRRRLRNYKHLGHIVTFALQLDTDHEKGVGISVPLCFMAMQMFRF